MNPINFKESNLTLKSPPNCSHPCSDLHTHSDGQIVTSCWKPTWKERFDILIGRPVWCQLLSGITQPPVRLLTDIQFAPKSEKDRVDEFIKEFIPEQ